VFSRRCVQPDLRWFHNGHCFLDDGFCWPFHSASRLLCHSRKLYVSFCFSEQAKSLVVRRDQVFWPGFIILLWWFTYPSPDPRPHSNRQARCGESSCIRFCEGAGNRIGGRRCSAKCLDKTRCCSFTVLYIIGFLINIYTCFSMMDRIIEIYCLP
jgi:hypothetical protein